jgi:uncharacterized membrane protein YgcG
MAIMLKLFLGTACCISILTVVGCAQLKRVPQKDRGYLSDPIMQLIPDPIGSGMESHNLPRREGSAGGSSGSGGGCGC